VTPDEARAIVHAAAERWSDDGAVRLAALIGEGEPDELADCGPVVVLEVGPEHPEVPGVSVYTYPSGLAERVRADLLHAWRVVSQACGRPMAAPGKGGRS
jgi:hypothetical protein